MAPLELQLTVLSVDSLSLPNTNNSNNAVHVTVHVDSGEESTSTIAVQKGETSATWSDDMLHVSVTPHSARRVAFDVKVSRKSFIGKTRSKTIGAATVAVADLFPCDCLRLLSYRLRDRDGEGTGVVNFSVRVKNSEGGKIRVPPVAGGVVIGIPAAWMHN